MTAGNVADCIGHGENRKPEGERNPQETDSEGWKCGGEERGAAASEDKPEGTEKFRDAAISERDLHASSYDPEFPLRPRRSTASAASLHRKYAVTMNEPPIIQWDAPLAAAIPRG
jgi:hypothetical protein